MTRDDAVFLAKQGARGRVGSFVIQGCRPESANATDAAGAPVMVRAHVPTVASSTPAQQAQRAKMAAAVAAWQNADAATREGARLSGRRHGMSGWNWYLSQYLKEH